MTDQFSDTGKSECPSCILTRQQQRPGAEGGGDTAVLCHREGEDGRHQPIHLQVASGCLEPPFICCFSKVQMHWFGRISLCSRQEKHFYFCASAFKACPDVSAGPAALTWAVSAQASSAGKGKVSFCPRGSHSPSLKGAAMHEALPPSPGSSPWSLRLPGRGLPANSSALRRVTAPGPLPPLPAAPAGPALTPGRPPLRSAPLGSARSVPASAGLCGPAAAGPGTPCRV